MSLPTALKQYLDFCPFYHGGLSRQEAEDLLHKQDHDCFLLRDSTQPQCIALSLFVASVQTAGHLLIYCGEGEYYLTRTEDPNSYPSIVDLLAKSPDLFGYKSIHRSARIPDLPHVIAQISSFDLDNIESLDLSDDQQQASSPRNILTTEHDLLHHQAQQPSQNPTPPAWRPTSPSITPTSPRINMLDHTRYNTDNQQATRPSSPPCSSSPPSSGGVTLLSVKPKNFFTKATDFIPFCVRCRAPLKETPYEPMCSTCQESVSKTSEKKVGLRGKIKNAFHKTKEIQNPKLHGTPASPPPETLAKTEIVTFELPHALREKVLFGKALSEVNPKFCSIYDGVPDVVVKCFDYLNEKQVWKEEGVFRLSGSSLRINQIIDLLEKDQPYDYNEPDETTITSLLKTYFLQNPERLFDPILNLLKSFLFTPTLTTSDNIQKVSDCFLQLPEANYIICKMLFQLLHQIQANSHINKMTTKNLSIVFKGTLNCEEKLLEPLILFPNRIFSKPLPERKK